MKVTDGDIRDSYFNWLALPGKPDDPEYCFAKEEQIKGIDYNVSYGFYAGFRSAEKLLLKKCEYKTIKEVGISKVITSCGKSMFPIEASNHGEYCTFCGGKIEEI